MKIQDSKNQLHVIIDEWIEFAKTGNFENHLKHFEILKPVLNFDAPPSGIDFDNALDFLKTKCRETAEKSILVEALDQIKTSWAAHCKIAQTELVQADMF